MPDLRPFKACVLGAIAALLLSAGVLPVLRSIGSPPARPAASGRPSGREAASGNEFSTSPLVVPAADFVSDGLMPGSTFFNFTGGYVRGIGTTPVAGAGCIRAPVYLPPTAAINSFFAYVYDNDTTLTVTVTVSLQRIRTLTGIYDLLGQVSTSGADASIQYIGNNIIDFSIVDNKHAYYLTTCLKTQDTRLYAVRIFYSFHHLYLPVTFK
jgi:hypothetical protein